MSLFRPTLASLALAALTACGGGGGGAATPAPISGIVPPAPVTPNTGAGVFDVNYGQFRGVYTFLDNGQFYGLHFVGTSELAGQPHGLLSASNSTVAREPIAWANFIDDVLQHGAQESSGSFGRTFGGNGVDVSIHGSMGTFSAGATGQKVQATGSSKTLYNDPMPLATLAGGYGGAMRSAGLDLPVQDVKGFTLGANGAFAVTSAGCDFSGTLSPHGSTGIFDVAVQVGGSACKLKNTLKGIVTPLGLTTLALQLDTADDTQSAVFILNKQ